MGTVELVVLDSVPESLAAEGADENHSRDVGRWAARLPRLLARAGACVLLVDHVTKAEEGRGRWARGSGEKLALVDGAAYSLNVSAAFSRYVSGSGTLTVAKDRHGMVGEVGSVVADVRFDVENGTLWRVRLEAPSAPDRETVVSSAGANRKNPEDVAGALEASGGHWGSRRAAAEALGMGRGGAAKALAAAVEAGSIVEEPGPNGNFAYALPGMRLKEQDDGP